MEHRKSALLTCVLLGLSLSLLGARPAAPRCGPEMQSWTRDPLPADLSPVDLSFMNERPAGSHGFLRAEGDHLVFEDGTPARFWGVNVQASALFRTKDALIVRHAKRIAQLGFNLVRLHHHDSTRFVKPALIDHKLSHSQGFNPLARARFDLWVSELKKNGVYVWLDLHTGRVFKEGDEIPGFEDLRRGKKPGEGKGFLYLNTRLQELMRAFNESFLGRVNPYTGLAYKDDPAVIGVLITNENDVTHHFGWSFRKSENLHHRKLFADGLKAFAKKSGVSEADVLAGRTRIDSKLWLNQIEHDFNVRMRSHLAKLGFRGVVATTNLWGGGRLHSVPSLTDGDLIDVHSYAMPNTLMVDPRKMANFVAHVATGQLLDRPLSVSEWSHGKPLAEARHGSAMYVAGVASLQGWDAPMLFGYSNRPMQTPGRAIPWSSFKDPPVMGLMPAAAVLFRNGHVRPAERLFVLEPDRRDVFAKGRKAGQMAALRTLVEQSRVAIRLPEVPELPWLKAAPVPAGATVVRNLDRSFLPAGEDQTTVRSDTGELLRDWSAPLFIVDTPRSHVVTGKIATGPLKLSRATFEIETDEATVALTSLDGRPLESSERILLSALGRACPEPGKQPIYRTEPILGTIRLRREGPPLVLRPLLVSGAPTTVLEGEGSLSIPLRSGSHWYLLSPP